jgi:hypothetical protein
VRQLPWKRSSKSGSQKQEERISKKPGARPQLNSGRTWSGRGDVRLGDMLIDAKDHSLSKSYRITEGEWNQLKRMAHKTPPGCNPMLQLDVGRFHLVVIEESLWDEIYDRLK